jgi:pilus assembly protein Flp/PilA
MSLFAYMRAFVRPFVRNEEGQDLLEYALLVALIAIVCIIAVGTTGTNVNEIFTRIGEELGDALPE